MPVKYYVAIEVIAIVVPNYLGINWFVSVDASCKSVALSFILLIGSSLLECRIVSLVD